MAALLLAEGTYRPSLRYVSKPVASACFVAVAVLRTQMGEGSGFDWLLLGLVLGALGDVALLFTGERAFLAGLGAFLLGHLAYVLAFSELAPPSTWLAPPALGAVLLAGGTLAWLWTRLGRLRVPVIVCIGVISLMLAAAVAVARTHVPAAGRIALGAALFAASDLSVARDRFVADSFVNKAWGLPAYYAGQLLLAWAIGAEAS